MLDIVLAYNDLDVDLPANAENLTGRFKMVYVRNIKGVPLMPTVPAIARLMLKQKKAVVVTRSPFTIRLVVDSTEYLQKVTLGIDTGAKHIGFSAVSDTKELMSGEVKLDDMASKRLEDRAMYRRTRRGRLWYREPRFDNRNTPKGWLPPSVARKYGAHLNTIFKIGSLLPISKINVEVGNFDIQKINNPDINGVEYQQGPRYEYSNLKSFVMAREKYICQLCGKTTIGEKTELHHIIFKSNGGTDRANNLALLHSVCHKKLHKQKLGKNLKKNKQYREATFMNIIKSRFEKDLDCELTFGYKTYCERNELSLEKSHVNDAFVIAGGTSQSRGIQYDVVQKRKNNRSLQLNRKGFKPSIRRQRYPIQPKDLVKIGGVWKETKGLCNYGNYAVVGKKYVNVKNIENVFNSNTLAWSAIHPPPEGRGSLAAN